MTLAQNLQVRLNGSNMKKLLFLLFIICIPIILNAQSNIVAEVAGEPITWLELQNRYETIWKQYLKNPAQFPDVSQKTIHEDLKKTALNQLITERLFEIFADENNISITDDELESIFIEIYSDNELFLTNGSFDYQKLQDFKKQHPDRYKKILSKIRDDMLDEKIKEIIKDQFYLDDRELYEAYVRENSRIQLEYCIIADSLMPTSFPSTPVYVKEFHEDHKYSYQAPDMVRIGFIYIEDDDFYPPSKPYYKHVTAYQKNAHNQARIFSEQLIDLLKTGFKEYDALFDSYHMFETGYLKKNDTIGTLDNSKEIIAKALRLNKDRYYSYPIEQEDGWIIFKVLDKKGGGIADFNEAYRDIWDDYIEVGRNYYFENESKNYYDNNIENELLFEVNVSYIELDTDLLNFDITFSADSLWDYYESHLDEFVTVRDTLPFEKVRDDMIEELTEKKQKQLVDSTLAVIRKKVSKHDFLLDYPEAKIKLFEKYIDNMPYFREPYPIIQDTIFKTPVGEIFTAKKGSKYVAGIVNKRRLVLSKEKEALKDQILNLLENKWDTDWQTGFQEFYAKNKNAYFEPTLYRFSYLYFPLEVEKISVDSSQVVTYFQKQAEKYIQSSKVKLSFIFVPEGPFMYRQIYDIQQAIKDEVNFDVISKVYHTKHQLEEFDKTFIKVDDLPEVMYNVVDTLSVDEISSPIYMNEGCYIIKMLDREQMGIPNFEEVSDQIQYEMKLPFADSVAYKKIKAVYDNITSRKDGLIALNEDKLFYTDYIKLGDEYTVIDSLITIPKREYDLIEDTRLAHKLPKIFTAKNGYAIVFLEDKVSGKKIEGYDAYIKARDEFLSKLQFEEGKIFTEYMTNQLNNNLQIYLPDIFSGLRTTSMLGYDDRIDNLKGSNIIVRNAFSRDAHTYSHPIRFTDYGWGFYYILKKEVGTLEDFTSIKSSYREEYVDKKFKEWLENYKLNKNVRIFQH